MFKFEQRTYSRVEKIAMFILFLLFILFIINKWFGAREEEYIDRPKLNGGYMTTDVSKERPNEL